MHEHIYLCICMYECTSCTKLYEVVNLHLFVPMYMHISCIPTVARFFLFFLTMHSEPTVNSKRILNYD